MKITEIFINLFVACMLLASPRFSTAQNYRVLTEYEIGGAGSKYPTVAGGRLYIPHATKLVVMDEDSGEIIGTVPVAEEAIHGVAISTQLKRGFITAEPGAVTIFDTELLKVIKKVNVPISEGDAPGFVLYEPHTQRVFPLGPRTAVLDARTGDTIGEVRLDGTPGTAVADGNGMLFVTIGDREKVIAINAATLKIDATYPLEGCVKSGRDYSDPGSLAYDATNHIVFVGCSDSGKLKVLDTSTGKIIADEIICSHVGGSAFDLRTKLIFESCSEGVVSIIRQLGPADYDVVETLPTSRYASYMAFDPDRSKIFLNVQWVAKHKPMDLRVLVVGE